MGLSRIYKHFKGKVFLYKHCSEKIHSFVQQWLRTNNLFYLVRECIIHINKLEIFMCNYQYKMVQKNHTTFHYFASL